MAPLGKLARVQTLFVAFFDSDRENVLVFIKKMPAILLWRGFLSFLVGSAFAILFAILNFIFISYRTYQGKLEYFSSAQSQPSETSILQRVPSIRLTAGTQKSGRIGKKKL